MPLILVSHAGRKVWRCTDSARRRGEDLVSLLPPGRASALRRRDCIYHLFGRLGLLCRVGKLQRDS